MKTAFWFARHELRLIWRDVLSMMTAGKLSRLPWVLAIAAILYLFLHVLAWYAVTPYAGISFPPDRETLVVVTGTAFLAWALMLSQAMESTTRAFYTRADLDLILSSPASATMIFALRISAIALATGTMTTALFGPFVTVLAIAGGAHWLAGYGVLVAMAAAATAVAVGLTVLMFAVLGPRRTRFIAQVVAAVVGAAFVIGVQAVSIFTYGSLSRVDGLRSHWMLDHAPAADSLVWIPARAAMGELPALALLLVTCLALLAAVISLTAGRFGSYATAAAGEAMSPVLQGRQRPFRGGSPAAMLRRKEWALLRRDPWLMSQTLMQILYLIPPALLLWRNFGTHTGALTVLAPVLVMAAGQLAGGLAWLAISGEDAPDLVATAPVRGGAVMRAKTEAVLIAVLAVMAPLLIVMAFASVEVSLVTVGGIAAAAASATAIQFFFRTRSRRSSFRRRQTASRAATFSEAISSISWAAATGLAANGNVLALSAALVAVLVVLAARMISPRQE